jgi:hypothetical protein
MHPDEPTAAQGISRRRFLTAASAVALAPLVPVGAAAVRASAAHPAPAAPTSIAPLSMGYVDGSGQWPSLRGLPWADDGVLSLTDVVPASSSDAAGPDLRGDVAVVTVHGLLPDPRRLDDPALRSVALDADLRADDPDVVATFFAWTLRARPSPSVSGRSVVRVPLAHGAQLGFDLVVDRGGAIGRASRRLGVVGGADVARLHRGAYLIALDGGRWDRARALPARDDAAWATQPSIIVTIDEDAAPA